MNTIFNRRSYLFFVIILLMSCNNDPIQPTQQVDLVLPVNNYTVPPSDSEVTLNWNYAAYANFYELQISRSSDFSSIIFNEKEVEDLKNLKKVVCTIDKPTEVGTYYWRVRGRNSSGDGTWSDVRIFVIGAAVSIPPDVPTLISPTNNALLPLPITFSWNSANNATSYVLHVSRVSDFSTLEVGENDVSDTTFTVNNLEALTDYYWRVRATNSAGQSNWSEERNFETSPFPPPPTQSVPEAPVLLSPINNDESLNNSAVTFIWQSQASVTNYILNISSDPLFPTAQSQSYTTTNNSYTANVTRGVAQYWRVRGVNSAGEGNWSNIRTFTVKSTIISPPPAPDFGVPTTPDLLYPLNNASIDSSMVTLVWQQQVNVDNYRLRVTNPSSETVDTMLTNNYYLIENLIDGLYSWRVTANNSQGASSDTTRTFTKQ